MEEFTEESCAVLGALRTICKKWTAFIISELIMKEYMAFTELKTKIRGMLGETISARVLSETLTELENQGVIQREVIQERPVRVNYSLTEKGRELEVIFGALKGWGIKWDMVKHKKCKSFTCMHDAILALDIEEAKKLLGKEVQ
ncbi:MAG: winged helix-turn-helix transcriptional regulator [Candidatus Hodarchaeales archaeon]